MTGGRRLPRSQWRMKSSASSPPMEGCRSIARGAPLRKPLSSAWRNCETTGWEWRMRAPLRGRWLPSPRSRTSSSAAASFSWTTEQRERRPMLRELALFGALAPSLLLYFLAAMLLFVIFDRLVACLGVYRVLWHPPLARFG